MDDIEAFNKYPADNWVYNKPSIAQLYGVNHGTIIPDNNRYLVKPNTNLQGCSIDSQFVSNLKGFTTPPTTSWYEVLKGKHWTVDFIRVNNEWTMTNIFQGIPDPKNHKRFLKWIRTEPIEFDCSLVLNNIKQSDIVNFELIGDKPIEVHLRGNTDPIEYDEFIPVWEHTEYYYRMQYEPLGYEYIKDTNNHPDRVGFWCRNNTDQKL